MAYILLFVCCLIVLILPTPALKCPELKESKSNTKRLISLNGFKQNETLDLYLYLKVCENTTIDGTVTNDCLMIYNYSLYLGLIAYITNAPRISDSLSNNCKVQVTISKNNPGQPAYINSSTQFYVWTDTDRVELLLEDPAATAQYFGCTFETVEKILRETFNPDSEFEMTLFDISGQNRTLDDYRQGNVVVEIY